MVYAIDIDGYIGDWYNSKKSVKNSLANYAGKPVNVRLNSLGGDVNHGLDISAQFETHGNVTVDMYSFNASASTVLSLGAKKVRMHTDGLYLIHKAMSWVDEWGFMNEDDIQQVIDQLSKEKKENETVTLILARKYAAKSGKSINEILDLMKQETWLTADQAKEWGFVDEVFGEHSSQKVNTSEIKARFNAIGLPIPTRFNETNDVESDSKSFLKQLGEDWVNFKNSILGSFTPDNKSNNNPENPVINMRKEWTSINAILQVEGIEETEGKVNLSSEQITELNQSLFDANKAKETIENDLKTKVDRIAELETELQNLKNADGATTQPINRQTDDSEPTTNVLYSTAKNAREMLNMLP